MLISLMEGLHRHLWANSQCDTSMDQCRDKIPALAGGLRELGDMSTWSSHPAPLDVQCNDPGEVTRTATVSRANTGFTNDIGDPLQGTDTCRRFARER